ncbi:hypothetical protein ACFUGD_19585 [Streptomyces sp. NPDC057217]|uniref:hypothetical protein n=1 Tax=Streptomyces sp. NPDC057217 TaxID=3346054 RepID=UPI003636D867
MRVDKPRFETAGDIDDLVPVGPDGRAFVRAKNTIGVSADPSAKPSRRDGPLSIRWSQAPPQPARSLTGTASTGTGVRAADTFHDDPGPGARLPLHEADGLGDGVVADPDAWLHFCGQGPASGFFDRGRR